MNAIAQPRAEQSREGDRLRRRQGIMRHVDEQQFRLGEQRLGESEAQEVHGVEQRHSHLDRVGEADPTDDLSHPSSPVADRQVVGEGMELERFPDAEESVGHPVIGRERDARWTLRARRAPEPRDPPTVGAQHAGGRARAGTGRVCPRRHGHLRANVLSGQPVTLREDV